MKLTFIELPLFTILITQIADDSFLNRLQHALLKNPEKATSSLGSEACARCAWQFRARGSGAGPKAKSENLTPDQERRLRAAVETIKREFRHENERH